MEEYILSQQAFDRLWARVRGETPPEPPRRDEIAVLLSFLEDTAQSLLLEQRLCSLPGVGGLWRDTRSRLARLETAYYLLTAERFRLPPVCPLRERLLPALRRDCLAALARSERYDAERERTPDPALSALYTALAGEEQRHAEALKRLIAAILCGEKK